MTDLNYCLRFPDGLRDKLKQVAKQNHRSMHSEIMSRISKSYETCIDLSVFSSMGERHADKTLLRIDPATHGELKSAAQAKARSLNAEINYRLLASFGETGAQTPPAPLPIIQRGELQAIRKTVANLLVEIDRIIAEGVR